MVFVGGLQQITQLTSSVQATLNHYSGFNTQSSLAVLIPTKQRIRLVCFKRT